MPDVLHVIEIAEIEGCKGDVSAKYRHVQHTRVRDISFPNFDESTKVRARHPTIMK